MKIKITIQLTDVGFIADVRGENTANKKGRDESWRVTNADVPHEKQLEAMISGLPVVIRKVVEPI